MKTENEILSINITKEILSNEMDKTIINIVESKNPNNNLYECVNCKDCSNASHLKDCFNCTICVGLTDCAFCKGLVGPKQYCINNVELSKDEYFNKLKELNLL